MKGGNRYLSALRRPTLGIALFALGTGGCALPWVDGEPDAAEADFRDRQFAVEADFGIERPASPGDTDSSTGPLGPSPDSGPDLDQSDAPTSSTGAPNTSALGPDPSPGPGESPPDDTASSEVVGPTPMPGPSAPIRLAHLGDPDGDVGREVPEWADLVAVELVDDRSGSLVVSVDVAGTIPQRLDDGEVAGIGVDLYTSGGTESDHQIFLDGSADGWFAYLHTDGELAGYPGTFRIETSRFSAAVSWDAIEGARGGDVAVFADWSTREVAGLLATSSEDRAPDQGRETYG